MNVIRRPRIGGKTTELLRRAVQVENAVVVVQTHTLAQQIRKDYNIEAVGFHQFIDGVLRDRNVTLFLDDVDILLQHIAGLSTIDTVTITTNSE